MIPGILIAGIGNIFLGDDAFGCEVIRRLLGRQWPEAVRIIDFGIRGFDLTYALLDGPETVILVDAAPRGGEPGTVYLIEPDPNDLDISESAFIETHAMNPVNVLRTVRSMGGRFHRVLLVACEPESFGTEDEGEGRMGLSERVAAAVDEGVRVVESLVADIQSEAHRVEQTAKRTEKVEVIR
ncbi:MAG: hydrogenase maturation protease [Acidobacteriota bacterium]|nr:hydrogenase maturation protease [Acidobacteriota bacterium]